MHPDQAQLDWITRQIEATGFEFLDLIEVEDQLRFLGDATSLFNNCEWLPVHFTLEQLTAGLGNACRSLSDLLWNSDLPHAPRVDCVNAMATLFHDLFARTPLDEAGFMWWDNLRTFRDFPDSQIGVAMVCALERIIRFDSELCVAAAIHGLGHLAEFGGLDVLRKWLTLNPPLPNGLDGLVADALRGEIL